MKPCTEPKPQTQTPTPFHFARIGLARRVLAVAALVAMSSWLAAFASTRFAPATSSATAAVPAENFTVSDVEWGDQSRGRRVPARLFWPDAARKGKVPLIVFSHGIGSSRDGYVYLGKFWAGHGIASLHLQHVGSDRTLWQGSVFSLVSRFHKATSDEEAIARVRDFSFALDQVLGSELGTHIARDKIVAAGHSYGANTALLASGARIVRSGQVLQFRDSRVSAAILISAPPFYGQQDFTPILSGITIPTLHVTTVDDVIRIPGFGSGLVDRIRVFDAIGGPFKALAVYNEGSHNVFTEQRHFDSLKVATQVKQATEGLSLAFLDQVFARGNTLEPWESKHRGIIAERREVTVAATREISRTGQSPMPRGSGRPVAPAVTLRTLRIALPDKARRAIMTGTFPPTSVSEM